jgi:hypothetical protein
MQAQDNVLFSGKIEEYEAAFNLVDTEKKGSGHTMHPACSPTYRHHELWWIWHLLHSASNHAHRCTWRGQRTRLGFSTYERWGFVHLERSPCIGKVFEIDAGLMQ